MLINQFPVPAVIQSLALDRDGSIVATASDEKVVRLWDTRTGTEIRRLTGPSDTLYCVAFCRTTHWLQRGALTIRYDYGGGNATWNPGKSFPTPPAASSRFSSPTTIAHFSAATALESECGIRRHGSSGSDSSRIVTFITCCCQRTAQPWWEVLPQVPSKSGVSPRNKKHA